VMALARLKPVRVAARSVSVRARSTSGPARDAKGQEILKKELRFFVRLNEEICEMTETQYLKILEKVHMNPVSKKNIVPGHFFIHSLVKIGVDLDGWIEGAPKRDFSTGSAALFLSKVMSLIDKNRSNSK